jgi:hypothetical protein
VQPVSVAGHPRIQFEEVRPSTVPAHCPFCDWQRVLGAADVAAAPSERTPLQPTARTLLSDADAISTADLDPHLSRGPPTV